MGNYQRKTSCHARWLKRTYRSAHTHVHGSSIVTRSGLESLGSSLLLFHMIRKLLRRRDRNVESSVNSDGWAKPHSARYAFILHSGCLGDIYPQQQRDSLDTREGRSESISRTRSHFVVFAIHIVHRHLNRSLKVKQKQNYAVLISLSLNIPLARGSNCVLSLIDFIFFWFWLILLYSFLSC